jgi:membrane protein implicated in regulation of membrane protease activity
MDQLAWIFWLVLGIGLIVAEVFTFGFVLFWFGIGAIAAALAGLLGFSFIWQFAVFAIVSSALTVMSRTIFSKYMWDAKGDDVRMGVDSLPGQIGTVTTSSKGALNEGAVRVYGSEWTAYPIEGETITEGEKVEVVSVKGSSIYVRPVRKVIPGWKQD